MAQAQVAGRLTCRYTDGEAPWDAVCEISKAGRPVRIFTLYLEDGQITDVTPILF